MIKRAWLLQNETGYFCAEKEKTDRQDIEELQNFYNVQYSRKRCVILDLPTFRAYKKLEKLEIECSIYGKWTNNADVVKVLHRLDALRRSKDRDVVRSRRGVSKGKTNKRRQ